MRAFRLRAGLTQRAVAERAGISVAGLRDIEQGRVVAPRGTTLRTLAEVLDLGADELADLLRWGRMGASVGGDISVAVLGPLIVEVAGKVASLQSDRHRMLLAMLALAPAGALSRDQLVEGLWGDDAPDNATELLQMNVSRLRRRLVDAGAQPEVLVAARGGYQLALERDQLDVMAFRKLVSDARKETEAGDEVGACARYAKALRLWRGRVAEDVPWLFERTALATLEREWRAVVLEYASVAGGVGRPGDAVPYLRQAIERSPLDEAAHAALVIALAADGAAAEAAAVYDTVRVRLLDELGADPGQELLHAHQLVVRSETLPPEAVAVGAQRQLPPDIADFSGRAEEIATMLEQVARADGNTAVVVSAIQGMGGVGKTRLAVHVARHLVQSGRFADNQLFVDLRGHSDQPPADPSAVLASFLRLLGVPRDQIPGDLESRAAVYRDRLYEKNAVVVLDNAVDEEQIAPLLPAGPGNLVLITSRRTLALDGGQPVLLDVFSQADALGLLAGIVGESRTRAERAAAAQLVERCGRLPLAVALVARRIQAEPGWKLADAVEQLRDPGDRIGEFAAGDRTLRTVFDLSYHALDAQRRHTFRITGLHPGGDFTARDVAALRSEQVSVVQNQLDSLVDEHLVTVVDGDRYRLHDLLREYAARTLQEETGDQERSTALGLLLNYYSRVLAAARKHLILPAGKFGDDVDAEHPAALREFHGEDEVYDWFDLEFANITAAVAAAAERGHLREAWRLAAMLGEYLDRRSGWEQWIATAEIGLAAARRLADRCGEAMLLNDLGNAYARLGQAERAIELTTTALRIRREIGDRRGEGWSLNNIAIALGLQGKFDAAIDHLRRALVIAREVDTASFSAAVLTNLGRASAEVGQYEDAMSYLDSALETRAQLNDTVGVGIVIQNQAKAMYGLGNPQQAERLLWSAVERYRSRRRGSMEASALADLGDMLSRTGRVAEARECWRQAGEILRAFGSLEADDLFARASAPLAGDPEPTDGQRVERGPPPEAVRS